MALAQVLMGGPGSVEVDEDLRPKAIYGKLIHDQCPRRGQYYAGKFAKNFGDPDCLFKLGCKGPITHADCNDRLWNNKTRWCIEAGAPCIGCAEMAFPAGLGAIHEPIDITANETLDKVAIGLVGAAALTTGVIAVTKNKSGNAGH